MNFHYRGKKNERKRGRHYINLRYTCLNFDMLISETRRRLIDQFHLPKTRSS